MVLVDFDIVKNMVEEFFNGQYEVKKFLGAGSFAEVYLVNHNYLDDLRAMKIIKEPLGSASNTKKVFHEVMLATQLRHENIISIYDAGVISTFGQDIEGKFTLIKKDGVARDDWAYFIMEYVQGGDLEQYLTSFINSNISMPILRVLDIIRQILLGLNTLHSSKPPIVHRDLKPNNILLSFNSEGEIVIKISDFGFAKEVSTSTIDVEVAGNKNYMAPECYKKVFSTKTDIYAVGVIFYQILTNHCPYNINRFDLPEVLDNTPWKKSLIVPSHYRSEIPKYIDDVLVKCLAINPLERYQDAMELLKDVEKCIDKYNREIIENPSFASHDDEEIYSEYIVNDSINKAFRLAKCENRLNEAIEILENEILKDYYIRKCYSPTLMIWKSKHPDVKLISQAFTANLEGNNYKLSCDYLKEAIAYNPNLKNRYHAYLKLWDIFSDLKKHGNLIKAVVSLEDLMQENEHIYGEYANVINTLRTYSADEILNEALRLADLNSLVDAAKLMEFAVVADRRIRAKYSYKLSLLKQNMKIDFSIPKNMGENTVNYAIDLGTTDSLISYYNDGEPIVIKNYITGENFTPSAVLIDGQDDILVGQKAREAIIENSNDAITEFKNNMGFSIPFKFDKSKQVMLPEELSAEVLKDLRKSVYFETGENIEHAVITVPANSNSIKTKAVNDAAELAGFRSHNLLLEPIAVAMAYGLHELKSNETWMIYDMGGATFNASLIKNFKGEIQKIDTNGIDTVGGNIFDWMIVDELLVPKIVEDLSLTDFRRDNIKYSVEFSQLKNASESAKIDLTDNFKTDITIKNLFDGYDFKYCLRRDEFRQIIESSINYSLKLCRDLLERNSLTSDDVSKIILAGGSALSPIIRELISEEFNIALEYSIDPISVVVRGAAVYAGTLEKPDIKMSSDSFSVLLKSNSTGISGRVFNKDAKFSYLGYSIEFENNNHTSDRISLDIDGDFKADLKSHGGYKINIYDDKNQPVKISDKSPDLIRFINDDYDFEMNIIFLGDDLKDLNTKDVTREEVIERYNELINDLDELNEYHSLKDIKYKEVLDYASVLMNILSGDSKAIELSAIYVNCLSDIVNGIKKDLDFAVLIENIENKLNIAYEKDIFDTRDFKSQLDSAVENKDLNKLDEIYNDVIEKYVVLNRDDVITSVFFNLRYEGIYTKNTAMSEELIDNGVNALNDSDFRQLFNIINQLYELDERNLDIN